MILLPLILLLVPPVAPKHPETKIILNHERVDDYGWLKDKKNPETIAYLKAENDYAEAEMADTLELQTTIYKEMRSHMLECDTTVPAKKRNYYYYSRVEPEKAYSILCRKKGSLEAPEEVIFDENLYAGNAYYSVGGFAISPNQELLAYAFDREGNEFNRLKIKDLNSGKELSDEIYPTVANMVWSLDGKGIFYCVPDEIARSAKVYLHQLGTPQSEDLLIFEQKDPAYDVGLKKSHDEKVIFIYTKSLKTTEIYLLDSDNKPVVTIPKVVGVEYDMEHHGDEFFVLSNQGAPDFKVQRWSEGQLADWIPPREGITIEDWAVFENYMVLFERKATLPQIQVIDLLSGQTQIMTFNEPAYSLDKGTNYEYATETLRFNYTSFVTPDRVYDYNMGTGEWKLLKEEEVPGYDQENYVEKRIYATADDGTKIPITLHWNKCQPPQAWFLTGYGAYGLSFPVTFSSDRLSLLDRGIGGAIAHVRGGGEGGKRWHEEGRLLNKRNTFTDFIAATKFLIAEGIVTPDKLSIEGRSAGGLLIGSVINMNPELFKVAIAEVPFVDALNTMLDPTIPLTVNEYLEWGNPEDPVYYDYIASYSPYDNVSAKNYPILLITGGLNDPRVGYWEPAKLAAKLRVSKTDENILLLKTNLGSGHFGASGRYDILKEKAFKYAFIIKNLLN
jgi:oligopeptidase B